MKTTLCFTSKRKRTISVYRTRKQRDLSIYSKRGEKVQKFTGKVYRKSEFFKKVNRSAEILEISGENSNGTEILNM